MLNGTIHVDSKLDVGSKFTVKIPKVNDNLKE
jgi:signal transduction histidine kinase